MSTITITETIFPSYQRGGASATLRIYADETFVASSGQQINRSTGKANWYKSVAGTVSSNNVTIPTFNIDSTVDSSNPQATYSAALFDSNGNFVSWMFRGWLVPHDIGSSLDWADLEAYNVDPPNPIPEGGYTQSETVARIDAAIAAKVQTAVVSSANVNYTAETTLADTPLSVNVEAGGIYAIDMVLFVACDSSGGFKMDIDGGNAAVNLFNIQYAVWPNSGAPSDGRFRTSADSDESFTGLGVFRLIGQGTVDFTSSGTFILRAAQASSNGTPTTLYRGSRLTLTKLN